MPELLAVLVPALLGGAATGLMSWGAMIVTVKVLMKRVDRLEQCLHGMYRSLGRLEGRQKVEA